MTVKGVQRTLTASVSRSEKDKLTVVNKEFGQSLDRSFRDHNFAKVALVVAGQHIYNDTVLERLELAVNYKDEELREKAIAYLLSDKCPKISELAHDKLSESLKLLIMEAVIEKYRAKSAATVDEWDHGWD